MSLTVPLRGVVAPESSVVDAVRTPYTLYLSGQGHLVASKTPEM